MKCRSDRHLPMKSDWYQKGLKLIWLTQVQGILITIDTGRENPKFWVITRIEIVEKPFNWDTCSTTIPWLPVVSTAQVVKRNLHNRPQVAIKPYRGINRFLLYSQSGKIALAILVYDAESYGWLYFSKHCYKAMRTSMLTQIRTEHYKSASSSSAWTADVASTSAGHSALEGSGGEGQYRSREILSTEASIHTKSVLWPLKCFQ